MKTRQTNPKELGAIDDMATGSTKTAYWGLPAKKRKLPMQRPITYSSRMFIILAIIVLLPSQLFAAGVLKMTKETLLTKLGTEDVIIIDVRSERDWVGSQYKIKGAVREDAALVKTWAPNYSKSSIIIAYCS